MLVCNLFLRAFARGVSSLCDEMYLVIYFFVPSHEVYLHDVTNMYLVIYRFVWRLTFDCAQMCFPKRHPPMRGRGYMRLFVCSSSPASCVSCFAKRHPPSLNFRG